MQTHKRTYMHTDTHMHRHRHIYICIHTQIQADRYLNSLSHLRNTADLKEIRREIEIINGDIQVRTLRARDLEEMSLRKEESRKQAEIEKVRNDLIK